MGVIRGRSRIRLVRLGGAILVVALLSAITPGAAADTKAELQHAKNRLRVLEHQIGAQRARLDALGKEITTQQDRLASLQGELNAAAQQVDDAESRYEQTRHRVQDTVAAIARARARYESLRSQLDRRARYAYEQGPASGLEVLLGATSLSDLSDKLQFESQIAANDATLANDVQDRANALAARRADLRSLEAAQASQLADLQDVQSALQSKLADAQSVVAALQAARAKAARIAGQLLSKQKEITDLVAHLKKKLHAEQEAAEEAAAAAAAAQAAQGSGQGSGGNPAPDRGPFQVCPVGQPHAYGDSFGAPRYAGGYHPHAGNDIMAPRGTPIYAPFAGYASSDPNGLGGNAVIVRGSQGYVYNAHLDSYGTLGKVSTGTVIGYVGDSGDAQGGPTHDHFEWHPNVIPANPYRSVYGYTVIGTAIDPYPYLNLVC